MRSTLLAVAGHVDLRKPSSDRTRERLVVEGGAPAIDVDIKSFKPVPESGITAAVEAMREGVTFRYGLAEPAGSHVSRF